MARCRCPHNAGCRIGGHAERRDLSAACRSDGDLVIALVAADYPCRGGVPLFSLAGLQWDNYLLRVGGGELVARATSGQYFRISPVSRP